MLGPRTHIYRHAQSTISQQTSVSNINSRTLNYASLISLFLNICRRQCWLPIKRSQRCQVVEFCYNNSVQCVFVFLNNNYTPTSFQQTLSLVTALPVGLRG